MFVVLLSELYVGLLFFGVFLQARHDHNNIAPCGMIKVLLFLNSIDLN